MTTLRNIYFKSMHDKKYTIKLKKKKVGGAPGENIASFYPKEIISLIYNEQLQINRMTDSLIEK